MKKKNRGKQFEAQVKEAFEKIDGGIYIRLKDSTMKFKGDTNPCDFTYYIHPTFYMLECKSVRGSSLPFKNIKQNQWDGLLEASNKKGVVAGYFIWFIDKDLTIYISAIELLKYRTQFPEKKSFSIKDIDKVEYMEISGKKKRILWDYDVTEFINKKGY